MKKNKLPHFNPLLLFFLLTFSCVKDDPIATKGNINGKVTELVTGKLISGAQVRVSGEQETKTTGQDGSYQFSQITAGSYTVNVSKSGYVSDSKTLTVIPEKTTSGDFILEKDLPTLSSNALIFNNEIKTTTLTLKNTRSGVMNFSIESSKPWLKPNPLSSVIQPLNEKIITVSVDFTNLPFGNYQEYIVINVGEASISIPVQVDYTQPPFIEIIKPNVDETYKMGEVIPVEWNSNLIGKVRLELYRFSSPFLTIAAEILNNKGGNYTWTLPAIEQESYQIRISSIENQEIAEISGVFNIIEGPTVPVVLTKNPIQNLSTSVQIPGEILNIGIQATEISQYGHVYSKNNQNPSVSDQKTRLGSSSGEKNYLSEITNLEPGETYYIRAYATNTKGTGYGDVLTITTEANVPVVETAAVLSIEQNSAISGGTVTNDGGSDIQQRGLCWGVNSPVTVDNNLLIDGTNTIGTFTTIMSSLSAATTYYIRAYAKNSSGVGYGEQKSFTTNAGLPSIKTILAQAKGATDAIAEGEVFSNGGENLISFGFVYALTTNPTIENNKIEVGENIQGEYSYNLSNLTPQKTYYLRAYATNSTGTVYGEEKIFNTNEGDYFIIKKPSENEILSVDQDYQIEWQSNLSSKRLIIEHFNGENLVSELTDNAYVNTNNYRWYLPKNLEAIDNNYIRILDYATLEEIGRSPVFEIGKHLAVLEPTTSQQVQPTAVNIKWESNYSTYLKFELYRGSSIITQIANGIDATAQQYTWNAAENFLPTAANYRIKMTDTENNQFLFSNQFELLPAPPGVNTISKSEITHQSVFCEGSVYNDTGASIIDRGFVWAVEENPTLENAGNNKISLSDGAQNFQTTIYNLNRNTTYYLRAYATSSAGTGYGSQLVFKTLAQGVLLNTAAVQSITHDSAQSGGTISDDGGAEITARGICWSTNPNPTIRDAITDNGTGTGSFESQLTGLNLNTAYFVRAYATSDLGTSYGVQQSFITSDGSLSIITNEISEIQTMSAIGGGNILDDGGSIITARGLCWSTNPNPTIENDKTMDGSGPGSFISQITGLTLNTTYYIRSYATNELRTTYGQEIIFKTRNELVYRADNGITIKADPSANIGDTGVINGVTYTVVDKEMLQQMIWDNEDISKVCTTKITNMSGLFVQYEIDGSDLITWDVSSVTDMSYMFDGNLFKGDLNIWDVSNVTNMFAMFRRKDLRYPENRDDRYPEFGEWDLSSVTNMSHMFERQSSDNYQLKRDLNISNWDVSSVTDMSNMFRNHKWGVPDITNWNVSNVTDMNNMFYQAREFNQDIGEWDVSNVTNMSYMFNGTNFNHDIGEWDVSNVTDMSYMFYYADEFNQDIGNWDVSNVTNMDKMFLRARAINQDLSKWNVDNVTRCDEAVGTGMQNIWTRPKPELFCFNRYF